MSLVLTPVAPEHRQVVPTWYPTVQVRATVEDLRRTGLPLETANDDLGHLTLVYAETTNTPIVLMRHDGEPEGLYTLRLDAERVARTAGQGVLEFSDDVLAALRLDGNEVIWRNDELERMFPVGSPV